MSTTSSSSPLRPIKEALREAGFDIYRSDGDAVVVAERVRENLILAAGVRVGGAPLTVAFEATAQRSHHPGLDPETLLAKARALGEPALARGYAEQSASSRELPDPSDPEQSLDQQWVVVFALEVADLDAAMAEVAFILGLPRQA